MTRRVRHLVAFRLRHQLGTVGETEFLAAAAELANIEGVEAFELLREISLKNDFAYALTMEFSSVDAYASYNEHPKHVRFIAERWTPEVEEFIEIDIADVDTTDDCTARSATI